MVWWLSFRKCGYILSMGCDQLCWQDQGWPWCPSGSFLDQYQWQFSNTEELQFFWKAVEEGNTEGIEKYLNRVLSNSVSVFDTKARNEEKESSYHNLLVGILTGNADWLIKSNIEAGEGFADIVAETDGFRHHCGTEIHKRIWENGTGMSESDCSDQKSKILWVFTEWWQTKYFILWNNILQKEM